MASVHRLQEIMEPAVTALGYELVGCELQSNRGRSVLRVYIDGPNGVTLDACVAVSRQIGAVLDVADPMLGRYELEVSSPGLARPLFTLAHYERFVGRKLNMRLRIPRGDRRNFAGLLTGVVGNEISIQLENNEIVKFNFNEIEKANLVAEI